MKLMVKGGVKRWIPDVFVGYYRELGYTAEGEETPSPIPQPEAVVAVVASPVLVPASDGPLSPQDATPNAITIAAAKEANFL